MTPQQIIEKYVKFFEDRGHKRIPNSPLVPINDPTTLFTSSGMQPLVPYLLGQEHPQGNRLVDVQNCFRAVDIDEVGDSRHTTFFRMLGNWSLGDYFKSEEIPWLWEFLTKELGLPKDKLYVTVYKGNKDVPYDHDSELIWKGIFEKEGIEPKIFADPTNWWSRSGPPDKMPPGEPGGPDTEVYFRFEGVEHKPNCKGDDPTKCECGKFLEIANSVFMQYQKHEDGSLKELTNKNVDFGGGIERLLAAVENKSDIFQTSLFQSVIEKICEELETDYEKETKNIRIIADHIKSAVFLLKDGVIPSNKSQGYVLRRLIRRVATKAFQINKQKSDSKFFGALVRSIIDSESNSFSEEDFDRIKTEVSHEVRKFRATLERGLSRLDQSVESKENLGLAVFNLFQSYGYPLELAIELLDDRGIEFNDIDLKQFEEAKKSHSELSKVASVGMFKGGLADHSEQTIKGHTATHLLHQAIRDMLGTGVYQSGSNITAERVRFDFNLDRNLTPEEISKLEQIVNEKIEKNLPITFEFMALDQAKKVGAIGLFDEKYSDQVKIYFIGDYSVEFCGGPHVNFTREVKSFKIIKQENIGNGLRRLYAKVG